MRNKTSSYLGNIGSLLQNLAIYRPQELAKRVQTIVRRYGRSGILPTTSALQKQYKLTEADAERLLGAAKRRLSKLRRDALALEQARSNGPIVAQQPPILGEERSPPNPSAITLEMSMMLANIRDRYDDEIRQRGEQTTAPQGFVYLITHDLFSGWVKVGMTIDYEIRLGTYNVSDPLARFQFASLRWVPNRRKAEIELLNQFTEVAELRSGEWFKIDISTAMDTFAEADLLPH